ncbi:UDP-glucose 4-epimerase [Cyberlindnera fabianii]|uniref:UDP-glucose 4-epimerase n=1 Tax=Cyberlindnera fabianii TaxID=36022 RepID=A0A1V2L5A7_CYBFA|nr:UDP-glucose 4-epimerase [Cyberlindnera fabianii]
MTITSYTLVTGGLGYIASHTIPLLDCPVIIIDNVSNSSLSQLEGIKSLTSHPVVFEKLDLTDKSALNHFFSRFHDGKSQINQTLIFASSAAVYGSAPPGVKEDIDCVPTTPYGVTKLKVEHILEQYSLSKGIDIAMLRYFNPIGVHPSGKLGEQSNNLMPIVLKSLREGKTMTL